MMVRKSNSGYLVSSETTTVSSPTMISSAILLWTVFPSTIHIENGYVWRCLPTFRKITGQNVGMTAARRDSFSIFYMKKIHTAHNVPDNQGWELGLQKDEISSHCVFKELQ